MKKRNKILLAIFILLVFSVSYLTVFAAELYKNQEKIPGAEEETSCFPDYLKQIINFGFAVIGILAMFMIAFGAFQYLMSAGNLSKAESAKETIASAVGGLILGLCAWIILNTINPDLVNMDLECEEGTSSVESPADTGTTTSEKTTEPKNPAVSCAKLGTDLNSEISAADNGVPPALLAAFMQRECAGAITNPNACGKNNSHGAGGAMQFLDGTWKDYGCSGSKFNRKDALACAAKKIAKDSGGDYSDAGIRKAGKRYCGSCTDPKACGGDYCDGIIKNYNSYKDCFK